MLVKGLQFLVDKCNFDFIETVDLLNFFLENGQEL